MSTTIRSIAGAVALAAAIPLGGAPAAAAAGVEDCVAVPAGVNNQSVLGHEIPGVKDVKLCVRSDHSVSGEPRIQQYDGCGTPCFVLVVRDLSVAFDIQLTASYALGGKPQAPVPVGVTQKIEPLGGTHQCVYSYWETYNPCNDGVSTPDGLSAQGGRGKVSLSWRKSFAFGESKVAGYEVLRSATGEDGSFVPVATTGELSFTDARLPSGTYWYSVVALDDKGNRSGMATPVSAATKR